MIIEYVRYTIPEEQRSTFEQAYLQAQTALHASPHCLGYELTQCMEDQGSYILRIEWDSVEGHLQGFRTSREFRAFFAAIRPFINDITEMRHYARTAVVGTTANGARVLATPDAGDGHG